MCNKVDCERIGFTIISMNLYRSAAHRDNIELLLRQNKITYISLFDCLLPKFVSKV